MGKYHLSDAEMDTFIQEQKANSLDFSDRHRVAIVEDCHARGLSVASHDDATLEHVRESASFGMSIAEFPTTRSEEHTSELQSLMRISYAVFCLKKKTKE